MNRKSSALRRAFVVSLDAANAGFDWENASDALDKVREETRELSGALESENVDEIEEEAGDLLLAMVNVCRKAGVDPDSCLASATEKFEARFARLEAHVRSEGLEIHDLEPGPLEERWQLLKDSG